MCSARTRISKRGFESSRHVFFSFSFVALPGPLVLSLGTEKIASAPQYQWYRNYATFVLKISRTRKIIAHLVELSP